MLQHKNSLSIKENYLFNGTDLNIKLNINQKDFLEKKEGDIIYQKGDEAEFVYLIIEGEVKLKISGVFNNPVIVKNGKNEFFGEKELVENTKRTTSAVANTNCILYGLDKASLNVFIKQDKTIKKNLFKSPHYDEPEETEGFEGQKEFFIKPEDSPKKFTFFKKEEGKKAEENDTGKEKHGRAQPEFTTSEPELTAIEPEFTAAEPELIAEPPKNFVERQEEIPANQNIPQEAELKWDFSSGFKEAEHPEPQKEAEPDYKVIQDEGNSLYETQADLIYTEPVIEPTNNEFSEDEKIDMLKKLTGFIENDIKYPLLTLKFYAEQIKKREVSKEINEVVDLLIEQANIISDTIEAAGNFAEGKTSLSLEPVNINAALDEILGVLADYVESQNSKLYKKYETTALVNLDQRQFYQAIFQVMKNACEAMPEGGNVYLISRSEGGHVKIEIKNTGKKIPRELHEKIFEPFFSFEKDNAAGLGLSIAGRIIKNHGGSIMIDSESEEVRFIISIPAAEQSI